MATSGAERQKKYRLLHPKPKAIFLTIEERKERAKIWQEKYRKVNPLKYLYSHAKRRAKYRGQDFSIELSDIEMIDYCPLLGIKIDMHNPLSFCHASIDRIDSSKGYVKGNVMIISHRANLLKNNSTSEELMLLAVNLKKYEVQL